MFTPRGDSSFLQNMDFLALSIQIGYVCLKQRSPRVPYARDLWLSERNPERFINRKESSQPFSLPCLQAGETDRLAIAQPHSHRYQADI